MRRFFTHARAQPIPTEVSADRTPWSVVLDELLPSACYLTK